jgi:hypothetical protein
VRKIFVPAILAILLAALILSGAGDVASSVADTPIFNDKVTDDASQASNSSASATITITMTGIPDQ